MLHHILYSIILQIFFLPKSEKNALAAVYNNRKDKGGERMDNNGIGEIIITILNTAIEIIKIYKDSRDE